MCVLYTQCDAFTGCMSVVWIGYITVDMCHHHSPGGASGLGHGMAIREVCTMCEWFSTTAVGKMKRGGHSGQWEDLLHARSMM